jgi:hypothetical protein
MEKAKRVFTIFFICVLIALSGLLFVSAWNMPGINSFLFSVATGKLPGISFTRKFGSIDSIQADTPADVWEYGATSGAERYPWCDDGVACITTMSSDDADDDEALHIYGLDVNGNAVDYVQNIDGQNKVTLTVPLWAINRVYNSNGTDLEGNVYVYEDTAISGGAPTDVTKVHGYVSIGEGQTLQGPYTVPAGKLAFIMGLETSLTKGVGASGVSANLRGRTREYGKVFRTQDEFNLFSLGSSQKSYNFPMWLPFMEKTRFCPVADVSINGVGISWAYTLLIIDY